MELVDEILHARLKNIYVGTFDMKFDYLGMGLNSFIFSICWLLMEGWIDCWW